METKNSSRRHAIVMGRSLGGLITAKVLSKHFERVTIIEKDAVNSEPESRKGQPYTRHLHGLLPAGYKIISELFPDIKTDLKNNGAKLMDFAETMIWKTYGGYRKKFNMNLEAVMVSRPLLEYLVRKRVLAVSNIELIDKTSVLNLIASEHNSRISGIVIENKGEENQKTLDANLIIDVTGRGSRSAHWLKELGYDAPETEEVKINVGYATRLYKRDPNHPFSNSWLLSTPEAPKETRFGGLFPIDGDRWIISVGGWHGDSAPLEEENFLKFIKSLNMPELYDTVNNSEPISDIVPYKFHSSLRRHYEKLKKFPIGYLVLGDAVSSFNPTYGQGMTSASLQAYQLDKTLSENIDENKLATTFFKKAAKVIDIPWQLAVGEDFRFPDTVGKKPSGVDFINKYVGRVHRVTHHDEEVCKAFLNVMSLIKPPTSLFSPKIFFRVMRPARNT